MAVRVAPNKPARLEEAKAPKVAAAIQIFLTHDACAVGDVFFGSLFHILVVVVIIKIDGEASLLGLHLFHDGFLSCLGCSLFHVLGIRRPDTIGLQNTSTCLYLLRHILLHSRKYPLNARTVWFILLMMFQCTDNVNNIFAFLE
jgi:hypothetical protein